jgi:protein-S-isoprenylcysteine O-methyltransferase Ste14
MDSERFLEDEMADKVPTFNRKMIVFRFIFTLVLMGVVLFLSAGTINWWEGWVYMVISLAMLLGSRLLLIIKFPEVAAERMEAGQKEDTKAWDKVLVPLVAIYLPMAVWVVAGLEKRFGVRTGLPIWAQILAFAAAVAGSMFSNWAMFHNKFFSSHVRIQKDRGHAVVKDGPYAIVRHPGYAGGFVHFLATPLAFNSVWTWIPIVILITAYVIRIIKEEATLVAELPGYEAYTEEVKYRLVPGVW